MSYNTILLLVFMDIFLKKVCFNNVLKQQEEQEHGRCLLHSAHRAGSVCYTHSQNRKCMLHSAHRTGSVCYTQLTEQEVFVTLSSQNRKCLLHSAYRTGSVCYTQLTEQEVSGLH